MSQPGPRHRDGNPQIPRIGLCRVAKCTSRGGEETWQDANTCLDAKKEGFGDGGAQAFPESPGERSAGARDYSKVLIVLVVMHHHLLIAFARRDVTVRVLLHGLLPAHGVALV